MIKYRTGTLADASTVAALHALSWQQNYRGSLKDEYLDHEVETERLNFWTKRLKQSLENERLILAEDGNQLVGFACVCADDDATWGALLDNLHVLKTHSGQGIGKALMQQSAAWIYQQDPNASFYLWVLETNKRGIKFYERLGGRNHETVEDTMYDVSKVMVCRMVWKNAKELCAG